MTRADLLALLLCGAVIALAGANLVKPGLYAKAAQIVGVM